MKTKNNNYNNLFDELDILDAGFEYEKTEIKYTATFYDKYSKDYDGFYYDGCNVEPFKNVSNSDRGSDKYFDSVQEIIDILPEAKKYHKDTTDILIERFVSFLDENDQIILFMKVGQRSIEV